MRRGGRSTTCPAAAAAPGGGKRNYDRPDDDDEYALGYLAPICQLSEEFAIYVFIYLYFILSNYFIIYYFLFFFFCVTFFSLSGLKYGKKRENRISVFQKYHYGNGIGWLSVTCAGSTGNVCLESQVLGNTKLYYDYISVVLCMST